MELVTPTQKPIEHPVKQEGIFDHRTHIRDENTGALIAYQPYAYHSFGSTRLYERPQGSGNMFTPNGDPCGRWELRGQGVWEKISDSHAPVKSVSFASREALLADENESLKAELAALKAEQEIDLMTKPAQASGQAKQQAGQKA